MHPPTLQQSSESKDMAILKIDAEIQSLMEQVRRLRSQRNVLTITYTLPAEILSKIFMVVQADCKDRSISSEIETVLEEWLVITQISQHWRSVALGCASLWCEIDETVPPAFIQEFLARSRGHSLCVDLTDAFFEEREDEDNARSLSSIFAETFRIQALHIETDEQLSEIQHHISSTPAPRLTRLHISGPVEEEGTIDLRSGVALFGGITPCLTDLSLSDLPIDLTSPLFMHNLTRLDVNLCFAVSTIDWLRVLKPMTHLSYLKLTLTFTDEIEGAAGNHTPIPKNFGVIFLPELSRLVIHGTWLESDLDFLAHITFPFQTQLDFSSYLSKAAPNLDEVVQSPLGAFLPVHSNSRCDSSKMKIDKVELEHSMRLVEPFDADQIPKISISLVVHSRSTALLTLHLGGLEKVHRGKAHLAEILSLPISQATSFTTNFGDNEVIWRMFSSWFPRLRKICVSGGVEAFLMALDLSHDAGALPRIPVITNAEDDVDVDMIDALVPDPVVIPSERPTLFKRLKWIHIEGMSVPTFEDALIAALRYRQAEGLPIKKIRLSQCSNLTNSLEMALKDLVEDVQYHECTRPQRTRRRMRVNYTSDSD